MTSTSYRLIDDGYPTFKKIVSGRKWIGRVAKVKDGYLGLINQKGGSKVEFKAATEDEAFREVVARHLGYPNHAAMAVSNSRIRAVNRQHREEVQQIASEMIRGNFEPLDKLFGFKK